MQIFKHKFENWYISVNERGTAWFTTGTGAWIRHNGEFDRDDYDQVFNSEPFEPLGAPEAGRWVRFEFEGEEPITAQVEGVQESMHCHSNVHFKGGEGVGFLVLEESCGRDSLNITAWEYVPAPVTVGDVTPAETPLPVSGVYQYPDGGKQYRAAGFESMFPLTLVWIEEED